MFWLIQFSSVCLWFSPHQLMCVREKTRFLTLDKKEPKRYKDLFVEYRHTLSLAHIKKRPKSMREVCRQRKNEKDLKEGSKKI